MKTIKNQLNKIHQLENSLLTNENELKKEYEILGKLLIQFNII